MARKALRYVEKQSRIATTALVDTVEEQHRLEALLEASKPRVPPAADGLHWLLRSAFRYPPLAHGSRFGTAQQAGILYLSEDRAALTADLAFYAFQFYRGMHTPPPAPVQRTFTVIALPVRTRRCLHTNDTPDAERLSDPGSWQAAQAFGQTARDDGAEVIRYPSARCAEPGHHNLAVLSPAAVRGNGEPSTVDAYKARVDASGVKIIGDWQAVTFHPAAELDTSPF